MDGPEDHPDDGPGGANRAGSVLMHMNYPRYSVLMSVYAKEKPEYLKVSMQSMLDQTVPPDEFVLVKDGPLSDRLENVIENFVEEHPKLFHIVSLPKNMGLGLALAAGIQECQNELVARMDSDDYSKPERCQKKLECFAIRPDKDYLVSAGGQAFVCLLPNPLRTLFYKRFFR